jgi:hypothetical protein
MSSAVGDPIPVDEVSDAIAGLRALGGSLPDAIDAAICRRAADVIERLRQRLDLTSGIGLRNVEMPRPDGDD